MFDFAFVIAPIAAVAFVAAKCVVEVVASWIAVDNGPVIHVHVYAADESVTYKV